jgi:hypothetical protein
MAQMAEFLGRGAIMMRLREVALGACGALLLTACSGGGGAGGPSPVPPQDSLPQPEPPPVPPPDSLPQPEAPPVPPPDSLPQPEPPPVPATFVAATAASGIAFESAWQFAPTNINEVLVRGFAPSGAAAGDYDNDGDVDLFITRGDRWPNLLYRNNGSGEFTDVAVEAGLAFTGVSSQNYRLAGPTFADMDGDGDLDLFVGGLSGDPSFIFANNGDGTFNDVTAGSGIDTMQARYTLGAAFGDYDLDGDLDMLLAHWGSTVSVSAASLMTDVGDTEHLWRNDSSNGTIVFTSVSQGAGISPSVITLPDPLKF